MHQKTLLLGGHMPRLETLTEDIVQGQRLGFSAIQFYVRSDQDFVKHKIAPDEITTFRQALNNSSIKYPIALDPFMKNLGATDLDHQDLMNELIADELDLCSLLGIPYLVIHPGTCSLRSGALSCISDISANLTTILNRSSGDSMILLQNMASGGKSIFYNFENLAQLYRDCNRSNRIGFCFDMCSAFSSGYDFGSSAAYQEMWKEFDNIVGLPLLKAIHINDSAMEKGSGVASHAHIGKGRIPYDAYRLIMNDKNFMDIPKIMEIPAENMDEYRATYNQLVNMLTPSNKQLYGIK